jgi:hypothetical protein
VRVDLSVLFGSKKPTFTGDLKVASKPLVHSPFVRRVTNNRDGLVVL